MNTLLHVAAAVMIAIAFAVAPAPSAKAQEAAQAKQRITFQARLSEGSELIPEGVEWRIYRARPASDGKLVELAYASGGRKAFDIAPGEYLVHAAYGHAGAIKRVRVGQQNATEEFTLNAGGLRLNADSSQQTSIPARLLRFDVYEQAQDDNGNRKLLARDVRPNEVIPFPVGTYHVVSRFGNLNAEIRADLRVQAGKLTDAKLQHRAAVITFRLVRKQGGDAIADTAWSILTENGEVIEESESTFPTMVLAEGEYTAIARNKETIFSQDFRVEPGLNKDVEVLAVE